MIRHGSFRWFLLIFPAFFAASAWALAQTAAPRVEPASNRAGSHPAVAPIPQQLFGSIPLSTKSDDARKSLELAWDKFVYFWEGQPAEGRAAFAGLAKEAAGKREPNSQFQIGMVQAMLAADPQSELEQLKSLSSFLDKPLPGMNESDRGINRASVLRERVRISALQGQSSDAERALADLASLATASRDQLIGSYFESASGYLLASKGDFESAAEGLAADQHSPLVLQQCSRPGKAGKCRGGAGRPHVPELPSQLRSGMVPSNA